MLKVLGPAALLVALAAPASALPLVQPAVSAGPGDAQIIQVYGGCGPYGHRGPYGGCRPGATPYRIRPAAGRPWSDR
jgi:hypothetical protein